MAAAPQTIVFAIRGPVARADLAGLTERVCELLSESGAGAAVCDVADVEPDAVVVDAPTDAPVALRSRLGAAAAELLMEVVTPSDVLGVAWARAVSAMAAGVTRLPPVPVVQLTVQIEAGPKNLGAASASVQFTRSIGAALGTASVGAVLFAALAAQDPTVAALFADIVERGPGILATVSPAMRTSLSADVIGAFRAAFLMLAVFSGIASVLAWSLPARRIS